MREPPWFHICVDMQRMFCEETPWHVPWMAKIIPHLEPLVGRYPEHTLFTRFITPRNASETTGAWQGYYRKWPDMTREQLPREMLDIVPTLARFIPPAYVFDKTMYSPWFDGRLHRFLAAREVTKLVISGGETDVCVLATVLGAIDCGYEVAILTDALCSSADETHDAGVKLLASRFSVQVEMTSCEELLLEEAHA